MFSVCESVLFFHLGYCLLVPSRIGFSARIAQIGIDCDVPLKLPIVFNHNVLVTDAAVVMAIVANVSGIVR